MREKYFYFSIKIWYPDRVLPTLTIKMTDSVVKRFTDTVPSTPRFAWFVSLNNAIEKWDFNQEQVTQAVHRVLLWKDWEWEPNILDPEIKGLVDDSKVAVNVVHEFIEYKFSNIEGIIRDIINDNHIIQECISALKNELIEAIKTTTPWKFYWYIFKWRDIENPHFTEIFEIKNWDTIESVLEKFRSFCNSFSWKISSKLMESWGLSFTITDKLIPSKEETKNPQED